jgi:hypothetical protein
MNIQKGHFSNNATLMIMDQSLQAKNLNCGADICKLPFDIYNQEGPCRMG